MFVSIQIEDMKLMHKHPQLEVVANLAWIECHEKAYCIFSQGDAQGLKSFTDMELKILYRNMTQCDHTLTRNQLLQVLSDAIIRVEPNDVNIDDLDLQASLMHTLEGNWVYVKGSKHPSQSQELFPLSGLNVERSEEEEQSARKGNLPAIKIAHSDVSVGTGNEQQDPAVKLPVKPKTGPKRGTAKAIIWDAADTMWKEAGEPSDKATVLALRKDIMTHLEKEFQIKRASSSSELGNWHKTRAPF